MSSQQSNDALLVTNASLRKDLAHIKNYQANGQVVVDKAHEIAKLVSQALQQHGKNASVVPLLLLSAAAKVWVMMNVGQAPQWERVRDDDSCMHSHPFFSKTKGIATLVLVPVPPPTPVLVLPPAPKVMSAPPINSLPTEAAKLMANKGKQPVWGTRRAREDDSDDGSCKKHKVSRVVSKALISDTEDEDGQPSRTIIVAKSLTALQPSKAAVPQTPAPIKKVKQVDTKMHKGQLMSKGKGKEKEVVAVEEQEQEQEAVAIAIGDKSKSTPTSKSKPKSRVTRAASCACPPTPVVESEDSVDDTDVAVDEDIVMSHVADTEQQADVAVVMPTMALTNDFPADHWPEETNNIPIPPPPPPPPPLAAELTIHERVAALAARVTAMEMANRDTQARIDAMEQDFDSCITSMQAEFTDIQLSFNQTVDVVTGVMVRFGFQSS
ncbi:hypothetical protein BDR05DRAFT_945370 [Suillus weaverae]|nr:hypothetical protein BDR05DRAFT_945370 [Suillus weaverae]